jgi:hypothetical protein
VVIIGGPRAGAELVMWALDQHPGFRAVTDGRWLGDLADALRATDESRAPSPGSELSAVRAAVRAALEGGPERQVYAGPQLTAATLEILALHPGTQFVHVARDPDVTAASLRASPMASGDFYVGEAAIAASRELNSMACMIEAALPPQSVLRLEFELVMARPVATMRSCVDFLGGGWIPACGRALAMSRPEPFGAVPVADPCPAAAGPPPTELAVHLRSWRRRRLPGEGSLPDRLRQLVGRCVPPEAVVSVVSKGDPELVALDTEQCRHFPEAEGGGYAGEYPATSEDAVELLESARRRGATHFVVPAPALWWLTFYEGLATHLEDHHDVVAFEQGTGIVFSLGAAPEPNGRRPTRAAVGTARRTGADKAVMAS